MPGDHVVAITRLVTEPPSEAGYRTAPGSREALAPETLAALAGLLGVAVYDLRMRLAGGAPWPVARRRTADQATELLGRLHDLGVGAVQMSLGACQHHVASRPLTPGATGLLDAAGNEVLTFARVWLLVDAMQDQERGEERIHQVVVAHTQQGIPVTSDLSRYQYERTRQRAIYAFTDQGSILFRQESLLAPWITARTGREQIDLFWQSLRRWCPQARVDDRLLHSPRKRTSFTVSPRSEGRDEVTSNASETDLAAHLLATAWRQRQIG